MPDIAMCINEDCALKFKCYRYTANPNEFWQAYNVFRPEKGECDHYWEDTRTLQDIANKKNTLQ